MAISQRTASANRLVYVDELGGVHEILLALLGGQTVWDGRISQTIPAATGAMTFVGLVADVSSGSAVTATDVGYATVTGWPAEVSAGSSVFATVGQLLASGLVADISVGSTLDAETGSLNVVGLEADVMVTLGPVFDPGQVTMEGLDADVVVSADVEAAAGTVALAGLVADVMVSSSVSASPGVGTIEGLSAEVSAGSSVTATDVGYATISGLAAQTSAGSTVQASSAVDMTLTGLAADVVVVTFTPMGVVLPTANSWTSTSPRKSLGWSGNSAFPGTVVVSDGIQVNGSKVATVAFDLTYRWAWTGSVNVAAYVAGVQRGSTVSWTNPNANADYNKTGEITVTVAAGETVDLYIWTSHSFAFTMRNTSKWSIT